jgi:hypothetical protein
MVDARPKGCGLVELENAAHAMPHVFAPAY